MGLQAGRPCTWGPDFRGLVVLENISPPPTCCQKVLDQRGETKCILCWYLHGGGYMNFSGLLLSRAFLMWLRPTPLAPGEREREMDTGAGLRAAW